MLSVYTQIRGKAVRGVVSVKSIAGMWKLERKNLVGMLGVLAGMWLFGFILCAIIMYKSEDAVDYALLGSFVMIVAWALVNMFCGAFSLEKEFGMAVSMGRTRQEFIFCYWTICTVKCIIELVCILLFDGLERVLAAELYRGLPCALDVWKELIDFRIILGAVIAIPAVNLFTGMLVMKFQKKAFWGLWVMWMLGCGGLPRALEFMMEHKENPLARALYSIQQTVISLGITGGFAVAVVISVVLLVVSGAVLKKQAVTYT